jgi:hypothetical protein
MANPKKDTAKPETGYCLFYEVGEPCVIKEAILLGPPQNGGVSFKVKGYRRTRWGILDRNFFKTYEEAKNAYHQAITLYIVNKQIERDKISEKIEKAQALLRNL